MMSPRLPRLLISHARRTRRSRVPALLATAACAAVLVTAATPTTAQAADDAAAQRQSSRAWSPFLDQQRAVDTVDARRVVVLFDDPSLGEWVATRGERAASPARQIAWLKRARALQQRRLDALAISGVQFSIEHRYLRVANGASIVVHGDGAQLLRTMDRVSLVTPVRTIWPTALNTKDDDGSAGAAAAAGAAPAAEAAGAEPVRVAVLDTGIEATHPAVAGHVLDGFDATQRAKTGARAAAAGTTLTPDPHGTAVAGAVLAGATKRADVQLLPVQVLTKRPALDGIEAVLGDSDDLLAGLEHAVDPDGNGDASDAADVAVVASTAPYAGFAGSPEDRAVAAADALGTLVVAAAGNDGASGDEVGTIGAVAASRAALSVGAVDLRGTVPAADVRIRGGGIDETFASAPVLTTDGDSLPAGTHAVVVVESGGDDVVDYLDDQLRSRVAGAVALVAARDGITVARQVRAAADAGAIAVLVAATRAEYAAGTIDEPGADIPAIGIDRADARAMRDVLQSGERISVSFDAQVERNAAFGTIAGFSSGGPRLDGIGRPDALASGVGMQVAGADGSWRHASGTSIAAAWAAGQSASVRAAHPGWTPAQVRAALLGSAIALGSDRDRPFVGLQGAGVLDTARAAKAAWTIEGGRIDFGNVAAGSIARQPFAPRSVDGTALPADARILVDDGGLDALTPSLADGTLVLDVPDGAAGGHIGGWLVLPDQQLRVPWTATVRDAAALTVPLRATMSTRTLQPVAGPGAFAGSLQLAIGGDAKDGSLGLAAVERLEVRLIDSTGTDRGVIGGLDQALPGIYTFGLTGIGPNEKALRAGPWQLSVRYVPASDPGGAWRTGPTATFAVQAAK